MKRGGCPLSTMSKMGRLYIIYRKPEIGGCPLSTNIQKHDFDVAVIQKVLKARGVLEVMLTALFGNVSHLLNCALTHYRK